MYYPPLSSASLPLLQYLFGDFAEVGPAKCWNANMLGTYYGNCGVLSGDGDDAKYQACDNKYVLTTASDNIDLPLRRRAQHYPRQTPYPPPARISFLTPLSLSLSLSRTYHSECGTVQCKVRTERRQDAKEHASAILRNRLSSQTIDTEHHCV